MSKVDDAIEVGKPSTNWCARTPPAGPKGGLNRLARCGLRGENAAVRLHHANTRGT